jgi:hypothetical protein
VVHQPVLALWEAFYVIIGTSAAALTGLQFVVIALISEHRRESAAAAMATFATPTVVHFGAVLLLSAILSAPWPSLTLAHVLVVLVGVAGVVLAVVTMLRARQQAAYVPVLEDWIWHGILPLASYATLVAAALMMVHSPEVALFLCGGSSVLLVFIGIHNAWDTATYLVATNESANAAPAPAQRFDT